VQRPSDGAALSASSDSGATLVHFVQAMHPEEIEALQAALRQAKAKAKAKQSRPATGDGARQGTATTSDGAPRLRSRPRRDPS